MAGPTAPDTVLANDNRERAGRRRGDTLEVRLEARLARWRPDAEVDSLVTVQVFAEAGGPPRIPGPLLRAEAGAIMRVSLRNSIADSMLIVHGLRAGAGRGPDTLHVLPGTTREVVFAAGQPGTFLYWGSTSGQPLETREGRDGQLNGAIVIDPRGSAPDRAERIFVISLIDILPDSAKPPPREDVFEVAINGRSWPWTERLHYDVGDRVRWRFVNATDRPHPMHLHGFHFRVLAKGDGRTDTTYRAAETRLAVTELMLPGSTFRLEWVPTRAGNWLMHCHMAAHITPHPERPDSTRRAHDGHDLRAHPLEAMAGLVLGIAVVDPNPHPVTLASAPATRHMTLLVQQGMDSAGVLRRGFVLQQEGAVSADSVPTTSPVLLLERDRTTAVTVVNRLREPTSVHWHGMELESVYDGVPGWSGSGANLAPLIAPGDSFTVRLTPPRAGTFIYHTHMDEETQLATGLYGPLLVLPPGESYQPDTDLVIVIGKVAAPGAAVPAINGRPRPAPLQLSAGREYRLRFINILLNAPINIELLADSTPVLWTQIAKDGADLPPALQRPGSARVRLGVGETYDFRWRPTRPGDLQMRVRSGTREPVDLEQLVRVR